MHHNNSHLFLLHFIYVGFTGYSLKPKATILNWNFLYLNINWIILFIYIYILSILCAFWDAKNSNKFLNLDYANILIDHN